LKIITKISILLVLFFLAAPNWLFAQTGTGNLRFGNLMITPSLNGQVLYDDNIYLKNGADNLANKKESDWIYHVMPGIMLNYNIPERGRINLGYQGDWAFYNTNSSNNWKNQKVLFDGNYEAPGGLIIGLRNAWMTLEDPYSSPDQYAVGRVTKRWTDDIKGKIGYNFANAFKVLLYYNFYKQQYKDILDYSQDYYNNEFGLGLETKILSKTWGFARYHYGQRSYDQFFAGLNKDNSADYDYHRANFGLAWDPTAKINGELNFGYQWKTYKNEFTPTAARRENRNTWIAATSLTYRPITTTAITLNIDRAVRDTAADTNDYFDDTGIGLTLEQEFLTKFILTVGGQYSKNDYNLPVGNSRSDNNYIFITGLDYRIQKWMTLGVSYKYWRKDSNIAVNEYRDNQAMLTLKLAY